MLRHVLVVSGSGLVLFSKRLQPLVSQVLAWLWCILCVDVVSQAALFRPALLGACSVL